MQAIGSILVLAFAVATATATPAEDRTQLAQIVSDPGEQQLVIDTAMRSNVILENPCGNARTTILDRFSMLAPLVSSDDRTVTRGSWKQSIRYIGCGVERLLNVQVSIASPSGIDAHPLLPGLTHADPTLQLDVFRLLFTSGAFDGKAGKCTKGYVLDTAVINRGAAALTIAPGESWDELWTLGACGAQFGRVVRFRPDSTGTNFQLLKPANAP